MMIGFCRPSGVWHQFEDINFDSLPNQFVLKCTHDSGSVVICKDSSQFDFFDLDFNRLDIRNGHPNYSLSQFDKPSEFETMKQFASTLSQGI